MDDISDEERAARFKERQERFLKFAAETGPMPTGILAVPALSPTQMWIEDHTTQASEQILELLREDHEEERTHDESQEKIEAVIKDHLEMAVSKSTQVDSNEMTVETHELLLLQQHLSMNLDNLERLLTLVATGAPKEVLDACVRRSSECMWATRGFKK